MVGQEAEMNKFIVHIDGSVDMMQAFLRRISKINSLAPRVTVVSGDDFKLEPIESLFELLKHAKAEYVAFAHLGGM